MHRRKQPAAAGPVFRRRIAREAAEARARAPHVRPAQQVRVTLDGDGRPTLRPFPADLRRQVASRAD